MTPGCLPDQKETTQKYRKVTRIDQARMVAAVQSGQTQESVKRAGSGGKRTASNGNKNRPIPIVIEEK